MDKRWQEIERLYHTARELDQSARIEFFAKACAGDDELRREVESLLAQDEKNRSFLEKPALEMAAEAVAWDESLRSAEPPSGVAALILKPAILGGIKKTQAWMQWAQARDIQVVLSSCFEGPRALQSYARLAHQHHLNDIPQGLDTWRWLDLDWADYGIMVQQGRLWIQC